jgi:hypothetical protein
MEYGIVVVKSEFPSKRWLAFLHKKNEYGLNNPHAFSVKEITRQLATHIHASLQATGQRTKVTSVWYTKE